MNHTLGPWEAFPRKHPTEIKAQYGSPLMDDSQLYPVRLLGQGANQEANARLIAKAPDMLEMLEKLTAFAAQYSPNGCTTHEALILARYQSDMTSIQDLVDASRAILAKIKADS